MASMQSLKLLLMLLYYRCVTSICFCSKDAQPKGKDSKKEKARSRSPKKSKKEHSKRK